MSGPPPLDRTGERDSRGILTPWLFRQRTVFTRYAPDPPLDGLVDCFWAVRWHLPPGVTHRQDVIQHPSVNLTVATPDARTGRTAIEARLTGTGTGVFSRELVGHGWVVGMKSTVGGFGAFVDFPLTDLVDRAVDVDVVPGLCGTDLVRDVVAAGRAPDDVGPDDDAGPDGVADPDEAVREAARVVVLTRALERVLEGAHPDRVAEAREVAAIVRLAESDRSVRRLDDLAARAGVGTRALQRMFARRAGVSPTWVLRRYRLIDAAEAVRGGERVVWAEVAGELGYSDQAHLVRDFRDALGTTPEAYARAQR